MSGNITLTSEKNESYINLMSIALKNEIRLSNVVNNQAIINIGTAGHVAQGKSSVVRQLTGVATQVHKKEKEQNITIRLGYANCKLFRNPTTNKVYTFPDTTKIAYDPHTKVKLELLYQISFVDCPGHHSYISTMISGSAIMDYVLVVIAANESIPQPQTHEHLIALDYSGMDRNNICYLLNKLDLVKPKHVKEHRDKLNAYLKTNFGENYNNILPISAATGDNMDAVIVNIAKHVYKRLPKTIEQASDILKMYIVRSYNINRPNTSWNDLQGAVVGGSILAGVLAEDDIIEIRPGIINIINGKRVIQPLVSRVSALKSGSNNIDVAIPGGLIGVNLGLYAGLSGDDKLKGQILSHIGKGDPIYDCMTGSFRSVSALSGDVNQKLGELAVGDKINIVVNGIMNVSATILTFKIKKSKGKSSDMKGTILVKLDKPVVMNLEKNNCVAMELNGHLVAGLNIKTAECSMPIVYGADITEEMSLWKPIEWNIINDLHDYHNDTEMDFNKLASNITHITEKAVKVSCPIPVSKCLNLTTYLSDIDIFIAAIKPKSIKNSVDLKHVFVSNIEHELPNSKPRFNQKDVLLLSGRYNQTIINKFVDSFCNKLLTCPSCKSTITILDKDSKTKMVSRECQICHAVTYLSSLMMRDIL
uniref:Tr-type G domain-containing protein n=1 Tax=viral metagenome TaxID=1070528 RepID=A0A6C0JAD9_9ZZZZ